MQFLGGYHAGIYLGEFDVDSDLTHVATPGSLSSSLKPCTFQIWLGSSGGGARGAGA